MISITVKCGEDACGTQSLGQLLGDGNPARPSFFSFTFGWLPGIWVGANPGLLVCGWVAWLSVSQFTPVFLWFYIYIPTRALNFGSWGAFVTLCLCFLSYELQSGPAAVGGRGKGGRWTLTIKISIL
jgi:hypothetical protein